MRFVECWSECIATCQLWVHRDCSRKLKHRLRAVLCLLLYTHHFWAAGSEQTGSLMPQEKRAWQTSAPQSSEGQS